MATNLPVYWTSVDVRRLQQDLADVEAFAPALKFLLPPGTESEHHGVWVGALPVWPFARDQPDGLLELLDRGLHVEVWCSSVHPVVAPAIYPVDPRPLIVERSQNIWHVAPGGQLCLTRSDGDWMPSDRVSDLLLKACGWHVEYALMKAGVVDAMTERGIVEDASRDHLVRLAVEACRAVSVEPSRGEDG